jgi:hypothetical protein
MANNCWVLVHADSDIEWDNGDYVPHFDTEKEAQGVAPAWEGTAVRQREQPCLIIACGCSVCTEIYDQTGEGHIVHFDNADDAGMVTEAEWTKSTDDTYRCVACSPDGDCDCLVVLAADQSGETP